MKWGLFARAFLRFGEWLGAFVYLLGVRRAVALDGLARAFPRSSPEELRQLARANYRQLGRSLCELFLVRGASDEQLERLVRFDGWEKYEIARAKGRGVVCAIAHFGNFELLARATARRGVRLWIIVRRLNDFFGRWLEGDRTRVGARALPARGSSRAALEALRRNEVLAIAVDQNMQKSRGIFVDFFGSQACTTPAAAVFALRAGSPLVAAFPVRQPDGTHVVRVLGPFETALTGHAAVSELTQMLTKAVEDQVREHPDHWYWVHRRWKTQP
jgi:Kdo2-lipid IVA lauroyltransferase/acyltransferase